MLKRKGTGDTSGKGNVFGWVKTNWVLITLVLIFFLALAVRASFALDASVNNSPIEGDFVVSGGSDSYYHKRIIDHIATEHEHFEEDPLLNYPLEGSTNPRPPFWQWTVVTGGYAVSPLAGSVDTGVWFSFIFSTAFWGALTVIPVYFIGKSMFGKKVGLAAAFLLAIEAGHIERSVLTNADHDSFAMFFTVLGFYFFLRALSSAKEERWVENMFNPKSIVGGIKNMVKENQAALLYGMMAGVSLAGVALAWKGFSYIVVILGVYALAQLLVNRFRNADSTAITAVFTVTTMTLFLVALPWYHPHRIGTWFDVPFFIALAVIISGIILSLTRDLPWTFVMPSLSIALLVSGILVFFFLPSLWEGVFGGQGFLSQSKIYTTIAEAQAAPFSKFVLSFGAFTFFLAFAGAVWAIITFPKHIKADYLFVVVWVAATLYMASTQARFLFNASPSFALMAGWVLIMLIRKMDFKGMIKNIRMAGGGFRGLRKGIKPTHIVGILFLAFMILLPNIWYAVDAGIPYEEKADYDLAVYNSMPSFLQPDSYDEINGSIWYFGAFGYSMPIKTATWQRAAYWPDAWEYLASQDTHLAPEDRPAFVSWWDYGFEAMQEGDHPTTADNFQNGIPFAGNFLMSQSENEAIALFIVRVIEDRSDGFTPEVRQVLRTYLGENITALMEDIDTNPADYIDDVLSNPDRFGPRTSDVNDLTATNMKYTYQKILITENVPDVDDLTNFYSDIRDATGHNIRYFAVDSRLFPFSADNTGIFYAPATLSDHRISEGLSRVPYDFFEIKVVTDQGNFKPDEVPEDAIAEDYTIEYKDMFYNSMLYKCYMGYTGEDTGQGSGIPVVQNQNMDIQPAWGMKHFRVVYRTRYWNSNDDYENNTEEWEAVSFEEAAKHGENQEGILLPTYAGVYRGVVFIEYYDGAFLNGTITTEEGTAAPNVLVTVFDEYGIPHDHGYTDENGNYSILAPFGNLTVAVTTGGSFNQFTFTEKDSLFTENVVVTDAQSMREKIDADGDGIYDYNIRQDFEIATSFVSGNVFLDTNDDNAFSQDTDIAFDGIEVVMENTEYGMIQTSEADENGYFEFNNVVPGVYTLRAESDGALVDEKSISVGQTALTQDLLQVPADITGIVAYPDGTPVEQALVNLTTPAGLEIGNMYTDASGRYTFENAVAGTYSLDASKENYFQVPFEFLVLENSTEHRNLTLTSSISISGIVTRGGAPLTGATVRFLNEETGVGWSAVTDATGAYSILVPKIPYEVSCRYLDDTMYMDITQYDPVVDASTIDLAVSAPVWVTGSVTLPDDRSISALITFTRGDVRIVTTSNLDGNYSANIPAGTWTIHAQTDDVSVGYSYIANADISGTSSVNNLALVESPSYTVRVEFDDGISPSESLPEANIEISQGSLTTRAISNAIGQYEFYLPSNTYTANANAFSYSDATSTTLVENDTTTLTMDYANVTLSGTIVLSGDITAFSNVSHSTVTFQSGSTNITLNPDLGGNYSVSLVPGEWDISVENAETPQKWYQTTEDVRLNPGDGIVDLDMAAPVAYLIEGTIGNHLTNDGNMHIEMYDSNGIFLDDTPSIAAGENISFFAPKGQVYARVFNEDNSDVFTSLLNVAGPLTTFDFNLSNSATISGTLENNLGQAYSIPIPVVIEEESSGGKIRVMSNESGEYTATVLQSANFTLDVSHEPVSLVDGTFTELVYNEMNVTPGTRDMTLTATPLEAGLFGVLSSGSTGAIHFYSQGGTAVDNTATANATGYYTASLVPGEYILHVEGTSQSTLMPLVVSLDSVHQASTELDITLETGYSLTGHAEYTNLTNIAHSANTTEITGTTEDGESFTLATQANGNYQIVLPGGYYELSITETETEYGLINTYTNTTNITLSADSTLDLDMQKVQLYTMDSELSGTGVSMAPGASRTLTFTVTNTGNGDDRIKFSAEPANWNITFAQEESDLDFNKNVTVQAVVIAPSDARADHDPVTITATSVNKASTSTSQVASITVPQTYGLVIEESNQSKSWDGSTYQKEFNLNNTGNGPDNYRIEIANSVELANAGWDVTIIGLESSVDNTTGATTYHANSSSGEKLVTISATVEGDSAEPIGVTISAVSNNTSTKQGTVNIAQPDISVDDLDVDGEDVGEPAGQGALMTFIIILGALVVIIVLFGRPQKGRKR